MCFNDSFIQFIFGSRATTFLLVLLYVATKLDILHILDHTSIKTSYSLFKISLKNSPSSYNSIKLFNWKK
jgi:hypothetical protein